MSSPTAAAATTLSRLSAIVTCSDPVIRDRGLNDFIAQHYATFARIAKPHCRTYGLRVEQHLDDVVSLVAETALVLIKKFIEDPESLTKVRNFEGLLHAASQDKVRAYAHSEVGRAPASGMQSMMRRRAAIEQVRDQIRDRMHREPTDAEVVEAYNERKRATLKDAARQGALATEDDLRDISPLDLDGRDKPVEDRGDCELHSIEGPKFVQAILDSAAATDDPLVAAVARAWVGDYYSLRGGTLATPREIARAQKIEERTVVRVLATVRELATEILREQFGIGEPAAAA